MASVSEQWRKKGNQLYSAATNGGFSPVVKKERFQNAIVNFNNALQSAQTMIDRSSAHKNMGMASWRLGQVLKTRDEKPDLIRYYFKEALQHLSSALDEAETSRDLDWTTKTNEYLHECLQEAIEDAGEMGLCCERVDILRNHMSVISRDLPARAEGLLEMATVTFHIGVTALQNGDPKDCLKHMAECYYPIEEMKRVADEGMMSEIKVLEEDVFMQKSVAESIMARETADGLLENVLMEQEEVNVDMIWTIIDWYKQAILMSRECELEMEAIAASRLGKVYDKVLKMKCKAKEYFRVCVTLVMALQPRTFHSEDWYVECTEALQRYQRQQEEEEEKLWHKKRQKYIEELAEELKSIKESSEKNDETFLRLIYKNFPPKKAKHKLDEEALDTKEYSAIKKVLLKAIQHYHPDKQQEHGDQWVVLCEEITKYLTAKYESYK